VFFPSLQATSRLKDVLHDPGIYLFLPAEIFPRPQATSSLKDVLCNPRVDLFLPEEIYPRHPNVLRDL
jgi:hypothetical protein